MHFDVKRCSAVQALAFVEDHICAHCPNCSLATWRSARLHAAMQVSHERRNRIAARVASAGVEAAGGDTAEAPTESGIASDAHVALLTALPFGLAAAWMLLLARHSQATGAPWLESEGPCRPHPRLALARAGQAS